MAPQTGTALLLIAVFVLPGFVTLLIRERTYRVKDQDSPFERLLNALYFSSIVYVVLASMWMVNGLGREIVTRLSSAGRSRHRSICSSSLWVSLYYLVQSPRQIGIGRDREDCAPDSFDASA